MPKVITKIELGPIGEQVGWTLQYDNQTEESFALHLATARQFMQGLQELVLLLEHQGAQRHQGTQDVTGVQEQVSLRLMPPEDTE